MQRYTKSIGIGVVTSHCQFEAESVHISRDIICTIDISLAFYITVLWTMFYMGKGKVKVKDKDLHHRANQYGRERCRAGRDGVTVLTVIK